MDFLTLPLVKAIQRIDAGIAAAKEFIEPKKLEQTGSKCDLVIWHDKLEESGRGSSTSNLVRIFQKDRVICIKFE